MKFTFLIAIAAAALPGAARAGEVFGGVYAHDVKLPTDLSGIENGGDFELGLRGGGIAPTPLQPYIFGALNSAGATDYVAAGLSARFGKRIFIRPGLGLAIHNGSAGRYFRPDKIAF